MSDPVFADVLAVGYHCGRETGEHVGAVGVPREEADPSRRDLSREELISNLRRRAMTRCRENFAPPKGDHRARYNERTIRNKGANEMKGMMLSLGKIAAAVALAAPDGGLRFLGTTDREPLRVTLTFDDSLKDHLPIAAPELEARGWRGTFNLVTDWVGKNEKS